MSKTNKNVNIFIENLFQDWKLDESEITNNSQKIVNYFLNSLLKKSCLNGFEFDTLSFDILFCESTKTHEINKEYRGKDYPADIITFAIFADDEMKFVLDGEINLGEIIIALDKVKEEAVRQNVTDIYELYFLIAHGILHLLGFDHETESDYNFVVDNQKEALSATGIGIRSGR